MKGWERGTRGVRDGGGGKESGGREGGGRRWQ